MSILFNPNSTSTATATAILPDTTSAVRETLLYSLVWMSAMARMTANTLSIGTT